MPVGNACINFDPVADDDEKLLRTFRPVLMANQGHIKVAIFDPVMSMPGLRLSFEHLTPLCG